MESYIIDNEKAYQELQDYLSENPTILEERDGYLRTEEFEFFVKWEPKLTGTSFRDCRIPVMKNVKKRYKVIQNRFDLEELKQHILDHHFLAFDTETTGLHHKKEEVIGASFSGKVGFGYYLPIKKWVGGVDGELVDLEWGSDLIDCLNMLTEKEIITWNGSFDVRMIRSNFGIDLAPNIIADAQLMQHTVNEEGNFKLKKCAQDYQQELGLDVEKEANEEQIELKKNVAKNGGETKKTNFEMFKADLPVLGKYACADADLTLRLAFALRKRLDKEGLASFFYDEEVMPLYREVTIEMEDRGVKLDLDLMLETRKNILKDMEVLEAEIKSSLKSMPEFQQWFSKKVEEEYKTSKTGKFGQALCDYLGCSLPKSPKTRKYSMSRKNLESMPDGQLKSWLLNPDDESILGKELVLTIKKNIWIDENGCEINIQSKSHLKELCFDFLGYTPLSHTKTGPQFDDSFIQSIADKDEWAYKLSNYNKLLKIKSTYIDRFLDNHVDGFYYFSYKQWGTVSGRYGSDAQQIPRPKEDGELPPEVLKYNNVLRKFFIAEKGRKFIDADYESLEPHVFAHVSTDEGLRNIFRKGHDFYSTIAIKTEKLEGVSPDKKAENYLGKVNKPLRQKAKAYSLGIPYGMTDFALGKSLEIETKDAEVLVNGYLNGFPNLKKWMEDSHEFVHKNGYIKTQTGRVRHLPEVKKLYKIHGEKLLDFRYRKKCEKVLGKEETLKIYRDYKNGRNNAKNVQIQGLSASIVNRAAIACTRKFKELSLDAWVCAQVHDQLIFNVSESDIEVALEIVKHCMENTTKLSLDLKAPPEVADNWCEGH
jgi:DNA polymerase I-like protein with 3'-5' exonuclease and polymerase domains